MNADQPCRLRALRRSRTSPVSVLMAVAIVLGLVAFYLCFD